MLQCFNHLTKYKVTS